MAAPIKIPRALVIYAICLPLAAYLGYVLAGPLDYSGVATIIMVGSVLGVPILMRWYHPVTILSWNSVFYFGFLPGQLPMWMGISFAAFVIIILNRCVDVNRQFWKEFSISLPLVALSIVVIITAYLNGGLHMRSMGSDSFGGKRYFFICLAVMGYFVIANRRIPPAQANLYAAFFFLPGITTIIGNLVDFAGYAFYWLYYIIPTAGNDSPVSGDFHDTEFGSARIGGWVGTSQAVCLFMLARYGFRGLLDFTRPWRMLVLIAFLCAGLFGGFRSFLIFLGLVFAVAFLLEKLYRTVYVVLVPAAVLMVCLGLAFFAMKLPLSVQRAISFLPVEINAAVGQGAGGSSEWRLELWSSVLPDVSSHLLLGKGYSIDATDLAMAEQNSSHGFSTASSAAAVSGDYHNGPLSVIIPFGIWGAVTFVWAMAAIGRVLYLNFIFSDSRLRTLNSALFACFIAKLLFFLTIFGAIASDLPYFVGLAALSVSLNGELRERLAAQSTDSETYPAYI